MHFRVADRMLNQHVVLSYLNDDFWFDLHPSVYQIPAIENAIQELENPEKGEKSGEE